MNVPGHVDYPVNPIGPDGIEKAMTGKGVNPPPVALAVIESAAEALELDLRIRSLDSLRLNRLLAVANGYRWAAVASQRGSRRWSGFCRLRPTLPRMIGWS